MEKKSCPDCKGKKLIVGNCECDSEWRTTDGDGAVDDCICDPDQKCPTCNGTGFITA
ncbi:MAG: ankyrin [Pseudomonadota bacterium]